MTIGELGRQIQDLYARLHTTQNWIILTENRIDTAKQACADKGLEYAKRVIKQLELGLLQADLIAAYTTRDKTEAAIRDLGAYLKKQEAAEAQAQQALQASKDPQDFFMQMAAKLQLDAGMLDTVAIGITDTIKEAQRRLALIKTAKLKCGGCSRRRVDEPCYCIALNVQVTDDRPACVLYGEMQR